MIGALLMGLSGIAIFILGWFMRKNPRATAKILSFGGIESLNFFSPPMAKRFAGMTALMGWLFIIVGAIAVVLALLTAAEMLLFGMR